MYICGIFAYVYIHIYVCIYVCVCVYIYICAVIPHTALLSHSELPQGKFLHRDSPTAETFKFNPWLRTQELAGTKHELVVVTFTKWKKPSEPFIPRETLGVWGMINSAHCLHVTAYSTHFTLQAGSWLFGACFRGVEGIFKQYCFCLQKNKRPTRNATSSHCFWSTCSCRILTQGQNMKVYFKLEDVCRTDFEWGICRFLLNLFSL